MSTLNKVVGDTWQHRSATAVTLLSAGVMLTGIVLLGVGLTVLALVMLLWAVAPLLGGGFMTWFAEQQPVRTVAGWMLIPALGAALASCHCSYGHGPHTSRMRQTTTAATRRPRRRQAVRRSSAWVRPPGSRCG